MLPSLFATKDADAKNTCIRSAESFCIRDTCASNIYARGTYAGNAFSAIDACIKSAGPDDTGTEGDDKKSTCIGGVCTVKYSKIYLQSFSISEMELFSISWWLLIDILLLRYGSSNVLLKLETGVRIG